MHLFMVAAGDYVFVSGKTEPVGFRIPVYLSNVLNFSSLLRHLCCIYNNSLNVCRSISIRSRNMYFV